MKPICVPCQRFYRCKRNGVTFIEAAPKPGTYHNGPPPAGKDHADRWQPYKLWEADLWKCEGCGAEIITGAGMTPVSERHKPDFEQWCGALRPMLTVNDC